MSALKKPRKKQLPSFKEWLQNLSPQDRLRMLDQMLDASSKAPTKPLTARNLPIAPDEEPPADARFVDPLRVGLR